jgi:hypothetical protein
MITLKEVVIMTKKGKISPIEDIILGYLGEEVEEEVVVSERKETKPCGYWKSWGNFEREMEEVIRRLAHFPSQLELKKIGRHDLLRGARHHGSYKDLKEKFGFSEKNHSSGFWRDWSNVESELEGIIEQIGHFPTQRELAERGMSSLSVSMNKYHGGVNKVRKKLGFSQIRTPDHHYKKWENVESELKESIGEGGEIPSPNELRRQGRRELVCGVYTYHGGFKKVREKLGLEKSKLMYNDFYGDPDKIKDRLGSLIAELGRMPTTKELKKYSSKFYTAICEHFGGVKAYKKLHLNNSNEDQLESLMDDYINGGGDNG